MAGAQDVWRIGADERSKHDIQFFQLKPVNGFVTGTQARDFFIQSGLPTQILGQIWSLADVNGDGKMDKKEFSIAMHLIKKKLQGYELPRVLPPSLKNDPSPMIGSYSQPVVGNPPMSQPMGMNFPMGGMQSSVGMGMQQPQIQASLGTSTMTTGSLGMGSLMSNGTAGSFSHGAAPGSSALQPGGSIWAMPHNSKLKHAQTFHISDREKRGFLLGVEARAILMQSGLPQQILAQIWALSDIDRDGKLTCDEFCISMHLSELARMGQVLPTTLPLELVPVKAGPGNITTAMPPAPGPPKDAFGDLLSSVGMPLPVVPASPAVQPVEEDEQVTFEDKRKENFDKGQAELERRRAILREQQQKEENERLEKDRQEAEKRERQRQEVENRRQAELQKQLEKQREKEREIEEQRRKIVEQRESARRELERQRQMEWEKQRKEQLVVEKERESEQLRMMKSHISNLHSELETLESKKTELTIKITQVQKGVTDFTTSIDAMRMTRDRTLADIDVFERQSMELNKKFSALGIEKDGLNIHVQTAQTTPLSDAHRTVSQSIESKKASIQRLQKEMEKTERDTAARLLEIDSSNTELKNLKDQLAKLQKDAPQSQKQPENKISTQKVVPNIAQKPQEPVKSSSVPIASQADSAQPSWFDFNSSEAISSGVVGEANSTVSWDNVFSGTSNSAAHTTNHKSWSSSTTTTAGTGQGSHGKQKYRAMYDFPSGRDDELTLVAGMEVWVLADFTPVPGMEDWYKGEHEGKVGWFPKAYVERLDEPSADLFGSAFESLVQSSNAQTSETSQPPLFSSQVVQASAIPGASAPNSVEASTVNNIPPEGLLAKAIYPWKARQETDLTFDKDDVILVKEQQDMKWYGELKGKTGWFPKAYVKLTGVAPKAGATVNIATTEPVKTTDSTTTLAPADAQGEYYVALYTYTSDEPTDLIFNEGDIIYVVATSGDWWSGSIADQNKSGIFPASYVKRLEIQSTESSFPSPIVSSSSDSLMNDSSSYGIVLDDVFGTTAKHSVVNSTSFADDIDAIGFSLGGDGHVNEPPNDLTALDSINSSSWFSMNKPQQLSSPSMSFDGLGILGVGTAGSSIASGQTKVDLLGDFGQMPSSKSSSFVLNDSIGIKDDLAIDFPGGNEIINESWMEPKSSSEGAIGLDWTKSDKAATIESSSGDAIELDWGFGDFGNPTATSQPASSSFSLLDDFGLIDSSNTTSKISSGTPVSQGHFLDIMDGFGFNTQTESSASANSQMKSSMSLPDLLALENDAIQSDLFEAPNTASILKNSDLTKSGSHTSSLVQVNFDARDKKLGSMPAPPPPFVKSLLDISEKTPEQKNVKKPEIAKVIAPYVATGTGQLSLEIGNLINVRQKSPRGWWEGELQVRGQKKKTGWFPANYVKLLGTSSSARSTPEPTTLTYGAKGSLSATSQGFSSQDGIFGLNQAETVVALYPYLAQNDDELTFQKDAVITILSRDNPDWWSGQLDGQSGMFPSNYVTTNPQSQSCLILNDWRHFRPCLVFNQGWKHLQYEFDCVSTKVAWVVVI